MRKRYIRTSPKFYEPGTHPRDLRKARERFERGETVEQAVKKTPTVKAPQKPKKGAKKLKISTKQ